MNERHDATTSNSSMHERIEFLVSTNRQLQMLGVIRLTCISFDALPSQMDKRTHSGGTRMTRTYQFQHLSAGKVFKNCCSVNGSFSADTHIVLSALFEVSVDMADGEL